jgi:uncharacterized protein (DUF433 family)
MTLMRQAEQLLAEMSQGEKIQFLQMIARDLSGDVPGIVNTPDVCGGAARVAGTRIPVWTLVRYRQLGATEADLLRSYPTIRSEDLATAWVYYRVHEEEIEQQIVDNEIAHPLMEMGNVK